MPLRDLVLRGVFRQEFHEALDLVGGVAKPVYSNLLAVLDGDEELVQLDHTGIFGVESFEAVHEGFVAGRQKVVALQDVKKVLLYSVEGQRLAVWVFKQLHHDQLNLGL